MITAESMTIPTEDRPRPIVICVDECAELFATETDFEQAVADVLALLANDTEESQ